MQAKNLKPKGHSKGAAFSPSDEKSKEEFVQVIRSYNVALLRLHGMEPTRIEGRYQRATCSRLHGKSKAFVQVISSCILALLRLHGMKSTLNE